MSKLVVRNIDDMVDEAVAALDAGGTPNCRLIDGRIVAVFATPDHSTSARMAMGISVLPPGYSTPAHQHPAEEFAMIIRGTGSITIDDEVVPVGPGDLVVTPPDSVHITTSFGDSQLVVYWSYGPAGSEQRWLQAGGR
jgi:mannose-6-phosphate isomerase-like protein (cupin superfamily)